MEHYSKVAAKSGPPDSLKDSELLDLLLLILSMNDLIFKRLLVPTLSEVSMVTE